MSRRKRGLSILIVSVLLCLLFAGLLWVSGWGGDLDNECRDTGEIVLFLRRLAGFNDRSTPVGEAPDGGLLTVHFIDVGQGDAVLIQTPQDRVMLIDAGSANAGEAVLRYLDERGISQIDLVVGTHPHEDHIGGLIAVLENLPVGKVIDSGKIHTSKSYEKYLALIDEKKIPFEIGRAGKEIALDPSVTLKILHPGPDIEDSNVNNSSVVVQLSYGEVDFLFTGDAELEAESEILARGYCCTEVTVLKVGHHGSSSSTSEDFLRAVAPEIAVISLGRDNPYGHPHEETLDRLAAAGAKIFRTDLAGSIVITTDGICHQINTVPGLSGSSRPSPDAKEVIK